MKKQCNQCHRVRLLSLFNKNKATPDGYSRMCKCCNRANLKDHYERNKKHYLMKNQEREDAVREWYKEYKKTLKCSRCPEDDSVCLDFHHTRDKDLPVSMMINWGSVKRMQEEIAKCIVLCANCHRKEHARVTGLRFERKEP